MKIIDFKVKGNQVKFYVGADNCKDYWGDDWDDKPYEHNAGTVYSNFVIGYFVKSFDFDDVVMEPCDGHCNSRYSKDDMKNRKVPCVCVLPKEFVGEWDYFNGFEDIACNENAIKYYFNDIVDETKEEIHYVKNINKEKKYIAFSFEADKKTQKLVGNVFAELLSSYVNDLYKQKYEKENYIFVENFTIKEYKKHLTNLIKYVYKMYKLENVNNAIETLNVEFSNTKYFKFKDKITTNICVNSAINFDIGELHQNLY